MNAPALTRTAIDPVSGQRVEIRNDLTKRLRGQYACGPTLPNGEPEFGWRTFGEPVPIQIEAADVIEHLTEALKAIRQYGADTLSGRADGGPNDRDWQRDAVREMTRRARVALPQSEPEQ